MKIYIHTHKYIHEQRKVVYLLPSRRKFFQRKKYTSSGEIIHTQCVLSFSLTQHSSVEIVYSNCEAKSVVKCRYEYEKKFKIFVLLQSIFGELDEKSVSEVVCHSQTIFPFRAYCALTEKW